MAEVTKRLCIVGRVQGVAYRAWMIEAAGVFGIKGWVRNRRDGSVEALLVGTGDAVSHMIEACRRGPPAALVERIDVTDNPDDATAPAVFRQLPTQ